MTSALARVSLAALVALVAPAAAHAATQDMAALAARSAGADIGQIKRDVAELAAAAEAHIAEVGLPQALGDFVAPPWRRAANGLHLWGVNLAGMSWFDAGHPDLVGLRVSGMTDLEGRDWSRLAVESAQGSGERVFMIVYPHPQTMTAARGFHQCFLLADHQRVLCAGAFEDPA